MVALRETIGLSKRGLVDTSWQHLQVRLSGWCMTSVWRLTVVKDLFVQRNSLRAPLLRQRALCA